MKKLVLLTAVVCSSAFAADGGTDSPFLNLDAGVAQVESAQLPADAGVLGSGWWLSDERMTKVGQKLTEKEQPALEPKPGFWVGLATGATATSVVTFFIVRELVKK